METWDLEGVTDFKALRAKFQNDSDLANKLGQKPPVEIPPKPGSAGNTTSSPLPLAKREVKVSKPAQPPVLTQHIPLAQPQGHSQGHKGSTSEQGLSSPKSSPEKLSCGTDHQGSSQTTPEDPQLPESFQHVLQIWEETLSRREKTSPRVPTQWAASSAAAAPGRDRMPAPGSSPVLDWRAQGKDALHGSGITLPQAPRGHRGSDGAGAPREPPQLQKAAGEEDYLTPESAQLEEQNNYEETPMYLNQSGDTTTLCVIEGTLKGRTVSPERALTEDENGGKPSHERTKLEENKVFKAGGDGHVSPTSHAKAGGRAGLKVLQGKQDVTSPQTATYPTPPGLAKDRAEHWPSSGVGAPKAEGAALDQSPWQGLQAPEDIYDNVEELQDRLHGSAASSPFTSDSRNSYEETYEDVEIGGDNPAKTETEKQKRFGNLFKIEKLKLNNFRLKDNLRLVSISVPNLAAVSQEDNVYDDVEVGQRETRGKEEKGKVWMPKLRMVKEYKDKSKSIDDVERNIFKFKKSSEEKNKKMDEEEKFFRETFMFQQEIRVLGRARAERSVPSGRRADLPLTAGEHLDVIAAPHGHAVICRNARGRCESATRTRWVRAGGALELQTVLTTLRAALPWSIPEGLFVLPASVTAHVGQLWGDDGNSYWYILTTSKLQIIL
ncbi:hypothetical protein IHE44_0015132, partial [Lamprotornis superbus]